MWRSLEAHLLWEQGVGGSNPLAPTIKKATFWVALLMVKAQVIRDSEGGGSHHRSNMPLACLNFE